MKTFSASLGMTRHQHPGAVDAGVLQDVLFGRIAGARHGNPRASAIAARSGDELDDDERLIPRGQLVADQAPHAAVARDDRVAGQRLESVSSCGGDPE